MFLYDQAPPAPPFMPAARLCTADGPEDSCLGCSKAKPWMDSFIAKVGAGNKPNGLALHYYGTDSSACISWLTEMHTRYNLDVWVTEVASTSSNLQSVQSFQAAVMAWADQTTWVKGLLWFAASRSANQNAGLSQSALMGPDGSKLDLGYRYCYN